jgi:putative DNA primase/helicase
MPAAEQFRAAIRATGIEPPEVIEPGKLHRFSTNGKRSDDAGWCRLFDDGTGGVFGDWRTGREQVWQAKHDRPLTAIERTEFRRKVEEDRTRREAEEARRREQAKTEAAAIWKAATPASDHPYLLRKGVKSHGLRVHEGRLVIPIRDGAELRSLQTIGPDGEKLFLTGGRKKGCYFSIGKPDGTLLISEGYANGASVHEATGYAVAIAFDAGNLEVVATALRSRFPQARIVIAGDNDASGTGQRYAEEAARAVGGLVAIPTEAGKDWNDIHRERGADAVRAGIEAASRPADAVLEVTEIAPAGDDAEVCRLAALPPLQYDREREAAAKRLGVRATTLDDEIRRRRQAAEVSRERHAIEGQFPVIEPYAGDVDGGELLTAIRDELTRYVVFPSEHEAAAISLWVLHTYAIDAAYIAPIVAIQSPQKRCGKSTLLKLLRALVHRGLATENISTAALYRAMDEFRPTLLIDEADRFMDEVPEITGILNAGHSRGTRTLRIGGPNRDQLEAFDSFGAKAIAGIGKRRDTIVDRSITISLRRRMKGEVADLLRLDRLDYAELQGRCLAWAARNMEALRAADPVVPESLHDRAADNWRPLLAIADLCRAGTETRRAAMALSEDTDDEAASIMVLEDIRHLFVERDTDRLASADIINALAKLEERPWPEWRHGKPITQRQLARLLVDFGITPENVRLDLKVVKGYRLEQFADAFSRYLDLGDVSATPLQRNSGAGLGDFRCATTADRVADQSATATAHVADEICRKPSPDKDCSGATDRNPPPGRGGVSESLIDEVNSVLNSDDDPTEERF